MKISSVEPQKKNPKRFNIYLDGKFAFGADADTIVDNRLVLGKEISSEDLDKVLAESEVGKLMEKMYGLFSVRARSEKEIRDYLRRLSYKRQAKDQDALSDWLIEAVLDKLTRKGLINDLEFATAWISARRRSKSKGNVAIRMELIQKGIDRKIIDQTLLASTTDDSQTDLANKALYKRLPRWQNLPAVEFKKKATDYLLRQGFEYDLVKEILNDLVRTPEDDIE